MISKMIFRFIKHFFSGCECIFAVYICVCYNVLKAITSFFFVVNKLCQLRIIPNPSIALSFSPCEFSYEIFA